MASNFWLHDHFCKPLTQIDAATVRTWQMNDVGSCQFALSPSDPKFSEMNVQYGNLVRIEHIPSSSANGKLPDWVGIILPRRVWNKSMVSMAAFSAEAILTLRPMPWVRVEGTPRTIFLKILEYAAQADSNIVIQPGVVDDVNQTLTDDLRSSAYDHIIQIVKKTGMTWNVTGYVGKDGRLELYANLLLEPGVDTGVELNNLNSQLRSPILVDDGIPHNVVIGHSFDVTQRARFIRDAVNGSSLTDYGYMGINKTFTGLHDPSSVGFAAQVEANTFGRPLKTTDRGILDVGKTFDACRIGNLLRLDEKEAGFLPGGGIGIQGPIRVLRMEYDDLVGIVETKMEVL